MSAVKRERDIRIAKRKARSSGGRSGEAGEDFDPLFVAETLGGEFQLYNSDNYLVPYQVRVYANGNVWDNDGGCRCTYSAERMQSIQTELENKQLESAGG